ncbi:MAG TPA: transcriptional regulator [Bacillus bacterium]|nr:transcriptional regulator [Bacillus sp. (in: firmicutes)]
MVIKIAVIGSGDFLLKMETITDQLHDILIDSYPYEYPQEAAEIVKALKPCDAVFFSGALPYHFSEKERSVLPIPAVYLGQDEMAVASSLLAVFYHKNIRLDRISFDLIDSDLVESVLSDLGIETPLTHILDFTDMLDTSFDMEKILNYHLALWEQGLTDFALTSVHKIYDQLMALGVPAMRMMDPESSLIRGLREAKVKAELFKSRFSQIAACHVLLSEDGNIKAIQDLAKEISASIQELGERSYILYSTRGEVDAFTEKSSLFPAMLNGLKIGFGYGSAITEAEQNAKIALQFCKQLDEESSYYILTDEKVVLGPFPKYRKSYSLKNDDPQLMEISQKTRIGPANLSKILYFCRSRSSRQFTAADLADYLGVTRRSTERLLKKLLDHGYADAVGEEMTYHQGRPRAIYELSIPIY